MKFATGTGRMRGLIYRSGILMSEHDSHHPPAFEGHYEPQPITDDEKADAIAALAVITIAILTAIHFIYTGGLLAFFAHVL